MKVRYDKAKTPILFGVGGVIVAMVTKTFLWKYSRTRNFCCFYPIIMKFGTQDQYNMALWNIEFSELLRTLSVAMATTHIGKNYLIFLY